MLRQTKKKACLLLSVFVILGILCHDVRRWGCNHIVAVAFMFKMLAIRLGLSISPSPSRRRRMGSGPLLNMELVQSIIACAFDDDLGWLTFAGLSGSWFDHVSGCWLSVVMDYRTFRHEEWRQAELRDDYDRVIQLEIELDLASPPSSPGNAWMNGFTIDEDGH